jgi:hypothetical protein
MPSRKKAQGRERKAKKEQFELEQDEATTKQEAAAYGIVAMGTRTALYRSIDRWWAKFSLPPTNRSCMHGYFPEQEDPDDLTKCSEFVRALISWCEVNHRGQMIRGPSVAIFLSEIGNDMLLQILNQPKKRALVKKMLMSMATDFIMSIIPRNITRSDKKRVPFIPDARSLFVTVPVAMEQEVYEANILDMSITVSNTNLDYGNSIHFIHKRIPCKCLAKLDLQCRLYDKGCAFCSNQQCSRFGQPLPKKEVQVCMKCHSAQYCSDTCQKQAYASHKHFCKAFHTYHNQHTLDSSDIKSFTITKRGVIAHLRIGKEYFTPIDPSKINPRIVGSTIENKFVFSEMTMTNILDMLLRYQS